MPTAKPKKPAPRPTPEQREFAVQLRAHVDFLGATAAARLCGVSRRTIYDWMDCLGKPATCTRIGALALLSLEVEARKGKP